MSEHWWTRAGAVLLCALGTKKHEEALHNLSGYIMLAPLIKMADRLKPPPPVLAMARLLSLVFPKMKMPDKSIEKTFHLAFPDQETADHYRADPLVWSSTPRIRPMLSMIACLARTRDVAASRTSPPFMIIHSKLDIRTQLSHSLEFCKAAAAADKTVLEYEEGAHQLLQDRPHVTARFMKDVAKWLDEHLKHSRSS